MKRRVWLVLFVCLLPVLALAGWFGVSEEEFEEANRLAYALWHDDKTRPFARMGDWCLRSGSSGPDEYFVNQLTRHYGRLAALEAQKVCRPLWKKFRQHKMTKDDVLEADRKFAQIWLETQRKCAELVAKGRDNEIRVACGQFWDLKVRNSSRSREALEIAKRAFSLEDIVVWKEDLPIDPADVVELPHRDAKGCEKFAFFVMSRLKYLPVKWTEIAKLGNRHLCAVQAITVPRGSDQWIPALVSGYYNEETGEVDMDVSFAMVEYLLKHLYGFHIDTENGAVVSSLIALDR